METLKEDGKQGWQIEIDLKGVRTTKHDNFISMSIFFFVCTYMYMQYVMGFSETIHVVCQDNVSET